MIAWIGIRAEVYIVKGIAAWRFIVIFAGAALLAFGIWIGHKPSQPLAAPLPGSRNMATAQLPIDPLAAPAYQETEERPRADTLGTQKDDSLRSIWAETEQRRYADLLKDHACDTLVVPVQSQHFGFDRATRSLMTAQLASALAGDNSRCVVDPYIASSALGDGMRRFDQRAVWDLAKSVKASTIVWTYAGHDNHMKMQIFMRVEKPVSEISTLYKEAARKDWDGLAFADDRPPFVAWQDLLPEAAAGLGLGKLETKPSTSPEAVSTFEVPAAPEQLVTKPSAGPLDDARRYELLASLGPLQEFRPTERLFEKAWLAASMAADTPESRRIRARALLHLGYRPSALALLGGDGSAEARVLRALLDGNLPEALEAEKEVQAPVQKLIAAIEMRDLLLAYGHESEQEIARDFVRDTQKRSSGWASLLGARSVASTKWQWSDNLSLKAVLDGLYPIDGFAIEEVLRGTGAVGSTPSQEELQLLANRHVDRLLSQQPQRFCCSTFKLHPQELDFLQLVSARAQSNLERQVVHAAEFQGKADRAIELLDAYDVEFSGHPHFSMLRASALIDLALNGHDGKESQRQQMAFAAARNAVYWEQSGTNDAWQALVTFGVPSRGSAEFVGAYYWDFPPKHHWGSAVEALRFVATFPDPMAIMAAPRSGDLGKAFLAQVKSRFHGSRTAASFVAQAGEQGSAQPNVAALRAQIESDPGNWDAYANLAAALIRAADYTGAAAIVQKYPGFKEGSGENSVMLSNHAGRIASDIFWHGDIESAQSLYQLAARYDNGSDSSMLAAERLRLLSADYAGAAEIALARVSRYRGPYAFRDYLDLLFAHGYPRDGWAAFMQVAGRFEIPEFWFAALVGHRVEGASSKAVSDWLTSDTVRSIRIKSDIPALRLGMMFFLVDRAPFAELPIVLSKIEGTPVTKVDAGDGLLQPIPGSKNSTPLHRSQFRKDKREGKEGDLVPSPYVLFAPAYVALRRGDYPDAVSAFAKMANFYSIEGDQWDPEMDIALPYFAFAAAKSGDTLQLKSFLDGLAEPYQGFEFHLSQAYFAGLDHHVDGALEHLRAAFAAKPLYAGTNQITDYQYAETCIWLFDETHETKYRDLALAWARSYQHMDPTMAWAYALQAKYDDPKDKDHTRAVALALYLDRNSFWLSGVPKADIDRARTWLTHNNPFTLKKRQATNAI